MKLLFCPHCRDVVKLSRQERWCDCGRVCGRYLLDGAHAEVSQGAIVIGLDNHTLLKAQQAFESDHPDQGYRTLCAWVMGKDAPRVKWV